MATQLGECRIDAVQGATVRGWFRSVYEKNVHDASPRWAAMFLYDALVTLTGDEPDEAELRRAVRAVSFATPNSPETTFVIEVDNPDVLDGLRRAHWESYYIG